MPKANQNGTGNGTPPGAGTGPGVGAGNQTPLPPPTGTPSVDLAEGLPKNDYMIEAGNSGLRVFGGFVAEEFDPNLRGMRGMRMYREMSDSNPTIGAFNYVLTQVVSKLAWHLQPADQTPLSLLAQQFYESLLEDMDHTWTEFIQEALSMVIFGYAPIEIVLKMRSGKQKDNRFSSKFDDGMMGIRKLALRSQETVLRWIMDADNNSILGMVQMPWTGGIRMIPRSKMLLLRTRSNRNNPEGRSLLRNAYRPYYFSKRVEEIEGIGIERDLAGFPLMMIPAEVISAGTKGTDPDAAATLASYKNLVKNVKRNSQEGAVLPSDRDEHGQLLFELKLLNSAGKRNFDTNVIIERYQQQIASSVMADFLLLGHGQGGRGTGTLSQDKITMFYEAIAGLVQIIAEALNKELVPLIGELNGIPDENQPQFFTDKPEQVDLGKLGAYINALAASGMVIFPNKDLENYLYEVAGLPEPTDETRASQEEIQSAGGEAGMPGTGGAAVPGAKGSPFGQGAGQGPQLFGGAGQPPGGGMNGPGGGQRPQAGAQGAFGQQKQQIRPPMASGGGGPGSANNGTMGY
jgi:hypothetical protein